MTDDIAAGRLLLGARGWPHPEWRGTWFPEDLPQDWEFAYYSNEADCLLLPAPDWLVLEQAQLEEWTDDCESWFRFYLEPPPGAFPVERLAWFGNHLGGVLVDEPRCDLPEEVPLWQRARDAGHWVEHRSGALLRCWDIHNDDLVKLRERLQGEPGALAAIVVDAGAVADGRLSELRTLAEFLGVA